MLMPRVKLFSFVLALEEASSAPYFELRSPTYTFWIVTRVIIRSLVQLLTGKLSNLSSRVSETVSFCIENAKFSLDVLLILESMEVNEKFTVNECIRLFDNM